MKFAALNDKPYIVFLAYIAAFLPWTAFSTKDFISKEWKQVRRTRRAGYVNLLCSIIPALYILVYCAAQFAACDWKEGCAAIVALLFALLHGARSAWGLWQLHLFRKWCAGSIDALETMGVTYCFSDKERRERVKEQRKSAWEISDEVLVNDSIVDNQITHGEAVAFVKFGHWAPLKAPVLFQYNTWFKMLTSIWSYVAFWSKTLFLIGVMVWDGVRFSIGVGTSGQLRQVPNQPVEIWINWAIAFAAQGLRKWMLEYDVSADPNLATNCGKVGHGLEEWQKRASYFASEVLSTCIMQLWPELKGQKQKKMEPMLWSGWKEGSVMYSGRVVKKELLKNAITDGEGLPFGVTHAPFLLNDEKLDTTIGYGAYGRYLAGKIGLLDVKPEFCSEIERLNVDMLEWLAILLYMGRKSIREHQRFEEYGKIEPDALRKCEEEEKWGDDEIDGYGSLDQASRNLNEQLLRPLRPELRMRQGEKVRERQLRAVLPSFPCSLMWMGAKSRNRHVLKVGEVLDVWLSMIAGDGLKFVLELNKERSQTSHRIVQNGKHNQSEVEDPHKQSRSVNNSGNVETDCREGQREIEELRLRYQFGDKDCRCEWGMNYAMTFMGYRMEAVRSYLAEWARLERKMKREANGSLRFQRILDEEDYVICNMSSPCILSESLSRALWRSEVRSTLRSRQFQVRLLWELQNHFEKLMECWADQDEKLYQHGPESLELIALCVLSFPSIRLEVREESESDCSAVKRTRDWYGICVDCASEDQLECLTPQNRIARSIVVIDPVCGPQHCRIRVRFFTQESDRRIHANVSIGFGEEKEFIWEKWRDAFTGRLEGMKRWQEAHYMESPLDVIPSATGMDTEFETYLTVTNERFDVWKGWRPFRIEICMYELKQSGLLQANQKVRRQVSPTMKMGEADLHFAFSKQKRKVVSYRDAKPREILHAMSVIRDSIKQEAKIGVSGERGGSGDPEASVVDSLLKSARQLSRGDLGEVERALLLYETAAGEFSNQEAVEKGVEVILNDRNISDLRAVELIERFIGCILPIGQLTKQRMDSQVLATLKGIVLRTCEKLVCHCSENVKETELSEVLVLLSGFGEKKEYEKARTLMEVMVCTSETFKAVRRYVNVCQLILNADAGQRSRVVIGDENGARTTEKDEIVPRAKFLTCLPQIEVLNRIVLEEEFVIRLLERAIEEGGNVDAMVSMGTKLIHGTNGAKKDAVRAVGLFERAIDEGGSLNAMMNLGTLFAKGAEGVAKNSARAKHLFEKVCEEGGSVSAMYNLGKLLVDGGEGVPKDAARAKNLYEKAIEKAEHVSAMYNLGLLLEDGADGVPIDPVRAKSLYERAVGRGEHVGAMIRLGALLVEGAEGVAEDPATARDLFERAIELQGSAFAMLYLGNLLLKGAEGVPQDVERGRSLIEKATESHQ